MTLHHHKVLFTESVHNEIFIGFWNPIVTVKISKDAREFFNFHVIFEAVSKTIAAKLSECSFNSFSIIYNYFFHWHFGIHQSTIFNVILHKVLKIQFLVQRYFCSVIKAISFQVISKCWGQFWMPFDQVCWPTNISGIEMQN